MQATVTRIPVQPWFELEEFMNFAHETRLSNAAVESLAALWESWLGKLQAVQLQSGHAAWLAVWLSEDIELQIDDAWKVSPGEGFLINSLAQYLCMAAVSAILPQTAFLGCAPTPAPDADMNSALSNLKVASTDGRLIRRYAVLTYHPFRGGCEICHLQNDCPKRGNADFATITLPGHVAGED